jgi:hypothetical protein
MNNPIQLNLSGGLSEPKRAQSKSDLHLNRNADTWNDSGDSGGILALSAKGKDGDTQRPMPLASVGNKLPAPPAQNLLPCAESVIREGNGQEEGEPVHSSVRGDSKSVPKNSAGISRSCGSSADMPLITESQINLACAYFWGKRKLKPPIVSSSLISSIWDYEEELSILRMRTSI